MALSRLRERLVQREAARAGRAHGPAVPRLARGEPARARRGGAGAQGARRPGGDHRPGGPARVGRGGPRRRRRPEDRRQRAARGRAGPAPAARRLPAGRAARRVRAVRPGRTGRGGAGPGGQGGRRDAAGQGAAAGRAGRGRRARLGQGPGGDRRGRHGRAGLRGPGEPGLPHLPGRLLLPGQPRGRAGDPVTATYSPVQLARLLRLPEPTPEQAAVISAPLGPLAVIAGAGSGKSETMAARMVWLVANGMVRPDRVLGLTFTRKAAAEFADRVRSRLERLRRAGPLNTELPGTNKPGTADTEDPFGGDPVIGTYHAYAGRLVSDNALREGLEPSLRLITPALSWQLAAQIVAAYDGPMDEITWTPQTVTAAVLELAGDLSEHLRDTSNVTAVGLWLTAEHDALPGRITASVRKIISTQRAREQLLPLVSRYAAAKKGREVLDHGDQVALAARIASRHPEVGTAERARYQVVLLDEYQDTSHAQLVLLRALFGRGHPVTAVGDPCQSIYGWRGASAGNLRRFTADFPVVARDRPFG